MMKLKKLIMSMSVYPNKRQSSIKIKATGKIHPKSMKDQTEEGPEEEEVVIMICVDLMVVQPNIEGRVKKTILEEVMIELRIEETTIEEEIENMPKLIDLNIKKELTKGKVKESLDQKPKLMEKEMEVIRLSIEERKILRRKEKHLKIGIKMVMRLLKVIVEEEAEVVEEVEEHTKKEEVVEVIEEVTEVEEVEAEV